MPGTVRMYPSGAVECTAVSTEYATCALPPPRSANATVLPSCVSEEVVDRHPSVESLVAAAEDRDVIVRHVEAGLCEFASNFVHDGRRRRGAFGEEPESRGGAEGQRGVFPRALGYRLHRGRDERVEQRGRSVRVLGHLFKTRLFRVEHLVHQPRWRPIARVLELEHVHAIARASRVEYHDVPRVAPPPPPPNTPKHTMTVSTSAPASTNAARDPLPVVSFRRFQSCGGR